MLIRSNNICIVLKFKDTNILAKRLVHLEIAFDQVYIDFRSKLLQRKNQKLIGFSINHVR